MYEGNLVICDQEQQYARNLLQMFARNKGNEVQMYLFHTLEEVERFAEQKTVHTLLIGREYPPGQREQIPAMEKYVLVKNMQDSLAENETGVYRYQSAEAIWSQMCGKSAPVQKQKKGSPQKPKAGERRVRPKNLRSNVGKSDSQEPKTEERRSRPKSIRPDVREQRPLEPKTEETRWGQKVSEADSRERGLQEAEIDDRRLTYSAKRTVDTKGELIAVYSPIHRIGKTRFALELGRELAKKGPVLYLNLEEYAGGDHYFPDQSGQTLADLLYYARQEKGNLGLRVSTMAGQDEELDYILPMPCVQDLQGVSGEEWLRLFDQILENCIYQKVILDLGDSINGLFQILEACHTIYTPYIDEEVAHAKLNQYAENLRRTGKEKVLEKTIQKKFKRRDDPMVGK